MLYKYKGNKLIKNKIYVLRCITLVYLFLNTRKFDKISFQNTIIEVQFLYIFKCLTIYIQSLII